MPDVRTMYDKEFLYAFDLAGRDVTLTISRITQGKLTGTGGKSSKKPVIYFKERSEKGLGLCITNARTIAAMYGGFETEKWIGKRITMFPTTTDFGGRTVECIRIRPAIPAAGRASSTATPVPPAQEESEDERNRRLAAPTDEELGNDR